MGSRFEYEMACRPSSSYCWLDGKSTYTHDLPSSNTYTDQDTYEYSAYFSTKCPSQFGKNGRYTIVRKLGSGNHSNAWLCQDLQYMRHVAIKVVNKREPLKDIEDELCALEKIRRRKETPALHHVGLENVITLIGEEQFQRHYVFVLEPLTMSLRDLVDFMQKERESLDTKFIKKTALGLLRGLEFLHDEMNLIYCGAKPGNILFRLDNMEQATKDEVWNDPATNEPTDFKPLGRWLRFSKEGRKRFYETATVVMTDFGRSQWDYCKWPSMVVCRTMCIPEILLKGKWGKPVDVWCVGVVTTYMINKGNVFTSRYLDDQLDDLVRFVSGFSRKYVRENPRSRRWLDNKGRLEHDRPLGDEVGAGLHALLRDNLHSKDVDPAYKFLRRCLTMRQSVRPPARELVLDEWLIGPEPPTPTSSGKLQAADNGL